jgi:hypothetical protein
MKKPYLMLTGLLLLSLSACAIEFYETPTPTAQPTSTATTRRAGSQWTMPAELELVIGTLQLEGTDLAITPGQAKVLLPLWTDLKTITQDLAPGAAPGQAPADSTAQPSGSNIDIESQIDPLVDQIQAAMTPAQLQAIENMHISWATLMPLMQAGGVNTDGPGNAAPTATSAPGASGRDSAVTPPAGWPHDADDDVGTPANGTQVPAGRANWPPMSRGLIPPQLLEALIQLLEKTSGSEP